MRFKTPPRDSIDTRGAHGTTTRVLLSWKNAWSSFFADEDDDWVKSVRYPPFVRKQKSGFDVRDLLQTT